MSQTLKRVLIVCMAVAVIGIIVAGVYAMMQKNAATNTNTNNANAVANQNTNRNTNTVANTNAPANTNAATNTNAPVTNGVATDDQSSILRLARIFIERYGTFSNRNNFENITALEPFMTSAFQQESAAYISQQQANGTPTEFYSITTTVASLEMTAYSKNNDATVRVATRRVETRGDQDPTVSTQYSTVTFENVSGSWKVSGAEWE